MRSVLGAALVLAGAAFADPPADPKLDYLGMCMKDGQAASYCACVADGLGAKLKPEELSLWTAYLSLLKEGVRDQKVLIATLTEKFQITPAELGARLQTVTAVAPQVEAACANAG